MMSRRYGLVLREVGRLLGGGAAGALGAGSLLERFAVDRDPAAFEALVKRHGADGPGDLPADPLRSPRRRRRLPGHLPRPGEEGRLDPGRRPPRPLAPRRRPQGGRPLPGPGGPSAIPRAARGRGSGHRVARPGGGRRTPGRPRRRAGPPPREIPGSPGALLPGGPHPRRGGRAAPVAGRHGPEPPGRRSRPAPRPPDPPGARPLIGRRPGAPAPRLDPPSVVVRHHQACDGLGDPLGPRRRPDQRSVDRDDVEQSGK